MMCTRQIFQENLKYYRRKKGISQEKLSELINFGVTYITEIESRHKFPRPETIDLIAEHLGIEPWQLFQPIPQQQDFLSEKKDELADIIYNSLTKDMHSRIRQEISLFFEEEN